MARRQHAAAAVERDELAADPADRRCPAGHAAHRRGAKRDDQRRLDDLPFEIEPHMATLDLVSARPLVQAAFAARLELEMLDGVRDVDLVAINAGCLQRLRET